MTETQEIKHLLLEQSDKIDCLDDKIREIRTVLGGSSLGDTGLLDQFAALSDSYNKTKNDVSKLKWFAGLLGSALSAALAYLGIKINL